MRHVSIPNKACLYLHGVYMESCLYIHEACLDMHMTAIALHASWGHVSMYTAVSSLLTMNHVSIHLMYTWGHVSKCFVK
jgi:hypothetical protein